MAAIPPTSPLHKAPDGKDIKMITPGATLNAEGMLVIPGLGNYRLSLIRGGVDVTHQLIKDNPDLIQKMADAAWQAFKAAGAIDDRGQGVAGSLGDHVEIYQKGDHLALNPGRREAAVPQDVIDQTANEKYRDLTLTVSKILQDQYKSHKPSTQQTPSQHQPSPTVQKTPEDKPSPSKIRLESDTGESETQGTQKAGPKVTISLDKDRDTKKTEDLKEANKNEIWKHKALLGLLKGSTIDTGVKPELRAAINNWFIKPRINLYTVGQRYGECPMSELLQEPRNEALREVLFAICQNQVPPEVLQASKDQSIRSIPLGQQNESGEYEGLKLFLDLVTRNPRVITIETRDTGVVGQQIQTFAKGLEGLLKQKLQPAAADSTVVADFSGDEMAQLFAKDTAWSTESPEQQGHCTNLGAVETQVRAGSFITCLRSGKTTDEDSLRENIFFGCLTNLTKMGLPHPGSSLGGISWNPDTNEYEYQQVIETLMDYSRGKSLQAQIAEKLLGQKKEDDEKSRTVELIASIDKWPNQGIKVSFNTVDIPSRKITINLKKPILTQEVFSSTLTSKKNLQSAKAESERINWVGNQQLLATYLKARGLKLDAKAFVLPRNAGVVNVDYSTGSVTFTGPDGLTVPASFKTIPNAFWSLPAKQAADEEVQKFLQGIINTPTNPEYRPAAIALYALSTGKYPAFNDADADARLTGHEVHAAHLILYRKVLFNSLGISHSVQCFNGVDRTGIAVALEAALDDFFALKQRLFLPHTKVKEDISLFCEFYNRTLREFAEPVTVQSRGQWGLEAEKEIANPASILYLDADNTHDPENPYQITLAEGEQEASILGESLSSQRKQRNQAMTFEYVQEHMQPVINVFDKLLGIKLNAGLNLVDSWETLGPKYQQIGEIIQKVEKSSLKELEKAYPALFKEEIIYPKDIQMQAIDTLTELRASIESRQPHTTSDQIQLQTLENALAVFENIAYRSGQMLFTEIINPQQIRVFYDAVEAASIATGKKPEEIIGSEPYAELKRIYEVITDRFELFQDTLYQLRHLYERCDYLQKQRGAWEAQSLFPHLIRAR